MKIPTKDEADFFLQEAKTLNDGKWIDHSKNTGIAASILAKYTTDLDPDAAYILGILHDIGRRFGKMQLAHIMKGYRFMSALGFDDVARINITHTFPIKDVNIIVAKWDCDDNEVLFVKDYLDKIDEYNDYDRLIQLADYLSLHNGFTILEKRMIDIGFRYGVDEKTLIKWKDVFRLKEYFDKKIGKNIYLLLPNITETTLS
ncbi:MAG TPA: HD domain-containing protein [Spirochaetota bacterium]|nr:HD domain-containing protein [Spirochaetota bacterium]